MKARNIALPKRPKHVAITHCIRPNNYPEKAGRRRRESKTDCRSLKVAANPSSELSSLRGPEGNSRCWVCHRTQRSHIAVRWWAFLGGTSQPHAEAEALQATKPLSIAVAHSTESKSSTHCSIGNMKGTETAQASGALPDQNSWETATPKTTEEVMQHHITTTNE